MNPVLAELSRGGFPEGTHRGAVAVHSQARPEAELGDVESLLFPRSALKPFQILPLLERGIDEALDLNDRHRAILCASHGGDEQHVATVVEILDRAGVDPAALKCGSHHPLDAPATRELYRQGTKPSPLHNNCSGKHTGMLLLARDLGAPLDNYLDLQHPAQQLIRRSIAAFCGVDPDTLSHGIDGCSAPAYRLSLRQLARGMAQLADPRTMPEQTRAAVEKVFRAFNTEPHFISGYKVMDQAIIRAGQGRLLAKRGAEGVLAIAARASDTQAACGIALKVDDGAVRGYYPTVVHLLERLGIDLSSIATEYTPPMTDHKILNHRKRPVGELHLGAEVAATTRLFLTEGS